MDVTFYCQKQNTISCAFENFQVLPQNFVIMRKVSYSKFKLGLDQNAFEIPEILKNKCIEQKPLQF